MADSFFDIIFAKAPRDGIVEFAVEGVLPKNRIYRTVAEVLSDPHVFDGKIQTYFGPCLRKSRSIGTKENFAGSCVVWVDVDDMRKPSPLLPPSVTVHSGHGWHLYWLLDEFYTRSDQVEAVTQALANSVGGDSAWDVARIMRVPGTINAKENPNRPCEVIEAVPGRVYSLKSLYVSTLLGDDVVDIIRTGEMENFASRSERDWFIVKQLIDAGLDDEDVRVVFESNPCGDKLREDGDRYFEHTLERAHSTPKTAASESNLLERDNAYYKKQQHGMQRISTFVFEPRLLLEGEDQDWIMCDVRAQGTTHVWKDMKMPKAAFNNLRALSQEIPKASWVWLGTDNDVRTLLAHLVSRLQAAGMPYAHAVSTLGRHTIPDDDRVFYVAENMVLCNDGNTWDDPMGSPLVYVDPRREVPKLRLSCETPTKEYVEQLTQCLRDLNEDDVVWPLVGWFMATPFKPVFENYNLRFPVLNVSGTRGSGKSTLIQRVFQPLLGYKEARAYNANTTYFVTLTLLGSSQTVPVAFTEFRSADTTDFNRFVLLSYDTGRDPRGHSNQTTTDYPLTAPFCVDGEDMLDDPAALERIIAVQPDVSVIAEGTQAHQAFLQLEMMDLTLLARPYYMYSITKDIRFILDQAEEDIYTTFPETLPTRIRRNLTLCWSGVLLFSDFIETTYGVTFRPERGAEVLRKSLEHVYSQKLGRAATAADDFVETIANAAARKVTTFPWALKDGVLWFQLAPAFEYWLTQKARQRQTTLTQRAIRGQLAEMTKEYMLSPSVQSIRGKTVYAFGVDLSKAYESGLDVPQSFSQAQFVVDLE